LIAHMKTKVIRWLHGEVKTPPLSVEARRELGYLLRMVQEGEMLSMPHARPMPDIGNACHELRVKDASGEWRLVFALTADAIVVLDVFQKKNARNTAPRHGAMQTAA